MGALADVIKTLVLDTRLGSTPWNGINMGLSEANITPDHATVLTDLTVNECSFTGYSRQSATGWAASVLTADFHAYSEGDPMTFANSGVGSSGTIYCWFHVHTGSGALVRSGRFAAPFTLGPGQSIVLIPFEQETGE